MRKDVVPGSDGAGVVVATGKSVTRFQPGDRVFTITHSSYLHGWLSDQDTQTGLGGLLDGTFRQYGSFLEWGLVEVPASLGLFEAASLPAAGITAWNALYGVSGLQLKAGDTVLTQGTGGLSIFAAQFAIAAGAIVIATTSSSEKVAKLKSLGVHHVINYREVPAWGDVAKQLTPHGRGVDIIVEVGGSSTLEQSLAAIRRGGVIAVCGAVGGIGASQEPTLIRAWLNNCIVRGVAVGSRMHAEDMSEAVRSTNLTPVLDPKVFKLEDLKEGLHYLKAQKHYGKVVIDCRALA